MACQLTLCFAAGRRPYEQGQKHGQGDGPGVLGHWAPPGDGHVRAGSGSRSGSDRLACALLTRSSPIPARASLERSLQAAVRVQREPREQDRGVGHLVQGQRLQEHSQPGVQAAGLLLNSRSGRVRGGESGVSVSRRDPRSWTGPPGSRRVPHVPISTYTWMGSSVRRQEPAQVAETEGPDDPWVEQHLVCWRGWADLRPPGRTSERGSGCRRCGSRTPVGNLSAVNTCMVKLVPLSGPVPVIRTLPVVGLVAQVHARPAPEVPLRPALGNPDPAFDRCGDLDRPNMQLRQSSHRWAALWSASGPPGTCPPPATTSRTSNASRSRSWIAEPAGGRQV